MKEDESDKKDGAMQSDRTKKKQSVSLFSVKVLIVVAAVIVALCIAFYAYHQFTIVTIEKKHMTLASQIEQVAELTVLKNTYSDVICVKKTAAGGLAKAYSIVKYKGVIRAGVKDVSQIKMSFSKDGKSITVHVPKAEVLGNGLIDQEVFDEKNSVFVPITTEEIFAEINSGMQKTQEACVKDGFLDEADLQVKKVVSGLLTAAGFTEITIEQ